MNEWIVLSSADFKQVLSTSELAAYEKRGTPEILEEIIQDVVITVREAILNNRANALGVDGTIPRSLRREALAIARMDLITRCEIRYTETDPRPVAARKAEKKLELIAAGKWQIATEQGHVETPPSQSPEMIAPDPAYSLNPRGIYNV